MLNTLRTGLFALLIAVAVSDFAEAGTSCPPVSEKPSPEMMQAAMRNARDHGFLWRISKDGHTSFLYGTIHVAKSEWMFPGPKVMQALRATDTLALELDVMDPDIQSRMLKGMAALRNTALPETLTIRLRKQAEAVCVPYESVARFIPELQVVTLTIMVGSWEGLHAAYAIDGVLAGIGHGAKKNVVSLETPELQLNMLQMPTTQETISFVEESLDELEKGSARSLIAHIGRTWENSDYAEMLRYDEWCECLNTEIERKMMKHLLDERNSHLADRIDALHRSGKQVFAAVGSLHMFGSLGLPALMEKRGYRIERVDLKAL